MKLSEKYLNKELYPDGKLSDLNISEESIKQYGEICAIEAKKTLLVKNQAFMNNHKYIEQLEEATNALQEIAEREKL